MREITSVEIHTLIEELRVKIENGFVRKFYEIGDGAFRFQFYSSENRNTMVYCKLLSTFNETKLTETVGEPTQFAMGIRKRIENVKVVGIEQHGSDRIIIITLSTKDGKYRLILEMFGKGNVLLVNEKNTIEQCYKTISFRDRKLAPKAQYNFPASTAIEIWGAREGDILEAVRNVKAKKKVMAELSKSINIGPLYLEDIFNRMGIDPKGSITTDDDAKNLARAIMDFLKRAQSPMPRVYKAENVFDYAILPIKKYEQMKAEVKEYKTLSDLLDDMHSEDRTVIADESNIKRLEILNSNIRKQEELAVQLKVESEEYQIIGHKLFENMGRINQLIEYLRQNKRATLDEVKQAFKDLKIKELDLKNKIVKMEIEQ